jgi:DNA-binding transcriptional MerR regulator
LDKAPDAFRTISEVADEINVPQHVLRFWESRFTQIRTLKRGGGRRYYRPDDVDLLRGVRHLLYGEGYTIRGVQRILREQGLGFVQNVWRAGAEAPPPEIEEDKAADTDRQASPDSQAEPSFFEFPPAASATRREPAMMPPAAVESTLPRAGADGEQRVKLQAALDELVACRRLLDAALADNSLPED